MASDGATEATACGPPACGPPACGPPESSETEAGVATTVFVGGLDPSVRESDLMASFRPFGALVYAKVPRGKGCGFVQFETRAEAEAAIAALDGARVGGAGSKMRLSWVRANREARGGAGRFARENGAFFAGARAHYANGYGGYFPGLPGGFVPGMPGGMLGIPGAGMEFGAPVYFPAPGGGWTAPGGGWVPTPPVGAAVLGQAETAPRAEHAYAFASPEEAYALAQAQFFAAQAPRDPPEAPPEAPPAPAPEPADGSAAREVGDVADAQAASGPTPPMTPPGAKKAAGGGAAA